MHGPFGKIEPTVPLERGGTNGTSAREARANLDVPSLSGANTFTGVNTFEEEPTFAGGFAVTYAGESTTGDISTGSVDAVGGAVSVAAGLLVNTVNKAATYPVTTSDVVVNCTSGTFTVTLPTAVGAGNGGGALTAGQFYIVKNSGAGVITLACTGGQTIDGSATQTLIAAASLTVVSDGANWIIV